MLGNLLEDDISSSLPEAAISMFCAMLNLLEALNDKIGELDKEIARRAREDAIARRLMTIPGVGPITATAISALAPPAETFAKRARLCRLAWASTAATVDARQAEAGLNHQDGGTHVTASAHHREQRSCPAS